MLEAGRQIVEKETKRSKRRDTSVLVRVLSHSLVTLPVIFTAWNFSVQQVTVTERTHRPRTLHGNPTQGFTIYQWFSNHVTGEYARMFPSEGRVAFYAMRNQHLDSSLFMCAPLGPWFVKFSTTQQPPTQKSRLLRYTTQTEYEDRLLFFLLFWTILYDRYIPIQTLKITLLRNNVIKCAPLGPWFVIFSKTQQPPTRWAGYKPSQSVQNVD